MLTLERIVSAIADRRQRTAAKLIVLWVQVTTGREEFATQLKAATTGTSVLTVVLRGDSFNNPNSLLSDLNRVLTEQRQAVEQLCAGTHGADPLVVLLLSRTPLNVPQLCSPTVLPSWFPAIGGQSIDVTIEDLNRSADGRLNIPESRIDEICAALHRLERVLQRRLSQVLQKDHNASNALFANMRDEAKVGETFHSFLQGATTALEQISSPEAFRPSAREGVTVVARILRLAGKTAPDGIPARAKALATALSLAELPTSTIRESFVAVLFRPVVRDPDPFVRIARNLIVTVFAAAQLITAAAHSDDYPAFPVLLLQAQSFNLRMVLNGLCDALDQPLSDKFVS